jgi:hypothetical protein
MNDHTLKNYTTSLELSFCLKNLSLSPRDSYNYFSCRYRSKVTLLSSNGSSLTSRRPFSAWMRMLLKVSSQPSRVWSITPLGPLLHQPTTYYPILVFSLDSASTQPLELGMQLPLSSVDSIPSTLKPVLLTSRSKDKLSYWPVLTARC